MSPLPKGSVGGEGGGEHTVFGTDILIILGRNVDQDEMTFCIQDWSYHPLFLFEKDFVSAL